MWGHTHLGGTAEGPLLPHLPWEWEAEGFTGTSWPSALDLQILAYPNLKGEGEVWKWRLPFETFTQEGLSQTEAGAPGIFVLGSASFSVPSCRSIPSVPHVST